jgi:hypothetical protein
VLHLCIIQHATLCLQFGTCCFDIAVASSLTITFADRLQMQCGYVVGRVWCTVWAWTWRTACTHAHSPVLGQCTCNTEVLSTQMRGGVGGLATTCR